MQTPASISYTSGKVVLTPIVQIWEDLSNERAGWFRAFWCANPEATTGSPVIGYCSAGGSQPTIRQTAEEVRDMYPDADIYRNGHKVK